ncbi:MAG: hypothetical protein KAU44_07820 [Candidatus Marinimicrobia bacterium]|nr:hypothetical protein [Candidatus Neomarinimicrobiota bacterium]
MEKRKSNIGWYIIGSALIWGLTMIGCAMALKGTDAYQSIQLILGGGAAVHLIIIWGPLAVMTGKKHKEN